MMEIMEKALVDGVEHLLVLEDDAYPRSMFDETFPSFFKEMPEDWIGYKLFSFPDYAPDPVGVHCGRLKVNGSNGGTQAMGLRREGLRAWHDSAWRNIDCLYDQFSEPYAQGRMYRPIPYLFSEHNGISVANGSWTTRTLDPGSGA
jgi:hypothetical protein